MKNIATERETAGIRRSLFWSATAHLLGGFALLAMGTAPSSGPFRGVVDVFLLGPSIPADPVAGPAAPPAVSVPSMRPREGVAGERASLPGKTVSGVPAAPAEDGGGREDPGKTVLSPASSVPNRAGEGLAEGEGESEPAARMAPSGGGMNAAGPTGEAMAAFEPGRTGDGSGMGTALLRRRIQSRIVYPEEAVRRGQQGEVLLRIRIERGGVPSEVLIARSSGVWLLDEAASRGVIRAAPLPSDPGWVEVPIRFQLR